MAYNATYPVLRDRAGLHIWPPSAALDDDNLDADVPEWVLLERNPGLDYAAAGLKEPDTTAIV